MTSNNKIVMIAGDFNVGGGKSSSTGSKTDAAVDTIKTMEYLYELRRNDFLLYPITLRI